MANMKAEATGLQPLVLACLALAIALLLSVCWFLALIAAKGHMASINQDTDNGYDHLFQRSAVNIVLNQDLAGIDNLAPGAFPSDLMNLLLKTSAQNLTLLAALDPVISRRFLRRLSVPLLDTLYEATDSEFNETVLADRLNRTEERGFAVRISQIERQLSAGEQRFKQGYRVVTPSDWKAHNFTPAILAAQLGGPDYLKLPIDPAVAAPFPLGVAAPRGIILEQIYENANFPEGGFTKIGFPFEVRAQMLFSLIYVIQIYTIDGELAYWMLRNGTSSINVNTTVLPRHEIEKLDEIVRMDLNELVFHSERVASSLGAPFLNARWLLGGKSGPRFRSFRYFWAATRIDQIEEAVTADIVAGFAQRHAIGTNATTVYMATRDDIFRCLGCQSHPVDRIRCGSQPEADRAFSSKVLPEDPEKLIVGQPIIEAA